MKDIFVDIVDEKDELIYPRALSQVIADGLLRQIRMVKLLIINYDKELLVCRNALAKKGEDLFDCPVTAIVHAGETYEEAIIRATKETLDVDITDLPFHELGVMSHDDGVDCFTGVYELTYNELPDFRRTACNDFMWEQPDDLMTKFSKQYGSEKSLLVCLEHFYGNDKSFIDA